MPRSLTADNGAKYLMSWEFSESINMLCEYCVSDEDECEFCHGTGELEQKVPVSWDTIKAIYAKAVDHFTANPTE